MFSRSEKYYFDKYSVRELASDDGRSNSKLRAVKYKHMNNAGKSETMYSGQTRERWLVDHNGLPIRNKRTTLVIPSESNPFMHFATFPLELPRLGIKAACPSRVCAECGTPYQHDIERSVSGNRIHLSDNGYKKVCQCDSVEFKPGVVLDMFMGTGTTALAAVWEGVNYVGCDLNPEYVQMAQKRLSKPFEKPVLVDSAEIDESFPIDPYTAQHTFLKMEE